MSDAFSKSDRSLVLLLSSLKETMDSGMCLVGFSGCSTNSPAVVDGGGGGGEKVVSLLVKMSGNESGVSWSITGGGGDGGES